MTAILDLSNEYIGKLNDFRDELKEIVRKISIIEQTLALHSSGFAGALQGMGNIMDGISPPIIFYLTHREKMLSRVKNSLQKSTMWADRAGVIVRALHMVRVKVERVLDAQGAPPELLATDLCMPMPGSPC